MKFTPRSFCSISRLAYEQQMLQESTSANDTGQFSWATDVSACAIHRQLIEMHDEDVLTVQYPENGVEIVKMLLHPLCQSHWSSLQVNDG